MNAKTCPTCQSTIPENAPGGLCPTCVLRGADEALPGHPNGPALEEVAAAFPKLEIIRLIGHGGMGFVYQARQPELDRTVALKILSPTLRSDPAFEERFAREARVLGKLQHPNIVTLFEHGESGGYFYLMMEFVDGVNLRQAMSAGRFSPEQALAIVPAICDALQSAHAQGVWHRDIKPENILLDKDGRVKIADFGIARILGDPERNFTLTRTGGLLGSAAYMAPEQHEKPHSVDHRADIYSLGVVIYEMLTGELPLGRFPLPSQRAEVNARIDEIVMRTLEKERELRQQSAEEVKTDVEGMRRLQSPPPQFARKRTGSPALLIGCGVMLLLGLLAIPILLAAIWYYSLRTDAQRVAVEQRMEAEERLVEAAKVAANKSPRIGPQATVKKLYRALLDRNGRATFEAGLSRSLMDAKRNQPIFYQDFTDAARELGDIDQVRFEERLLDERTAEVIARGQRTDGLNAQLTFQMVLEDGDWKLNSKAPTMADCDSPESTIRAILQAARQRDGRLFQAGLSRSMREAITKDGEDPSINFGDFDKVRFVEERLLDEKTAEVVVESMDGSSRKITFRMIIEDGAWKLTEHGL